MTDEIVTDEQQNSHENKHLDPVTGSSLEKKKLRNFKIITSSAGFLVAAVLVATLVFGGDIIIDYGDEYRAPQDISDDLAVLEDEGFTFAFGTESNDPTNFSEFTIPEPPEALREQFVEAANTSPAFEHISSVEELIEYDQIDKNGTISEEAMREIISIAEETAE